MQQHFGSQPVVVTAEPGIGQTRRGDFRLARFAHPDWNLALKRGSSIQLLANVTAKFVLEVLVGAVTHVLGELTRKLQKLPPATAPQPPLPRLGLWPPHPVTPKTLPSHTRQTSDVLLGTVGRGGLRREVLL